MERAILFRFHKEIEVCESRIRLLKEMNPEAEIYGLGERIEGVERLFDAGMEHLHVIDRKDSDWKWKNGDLAVRDWFNHKGGQVSFDMLHIVEWDLLLTEPLSDLYGNVGKNSVSLTGLKPIKEAEEYGWKWVAEEPYREEWRRLRKKVEEQLGYKGNSYGCIFPGACLPRSFLEEFSRLDVPPLCNDEVRVPLYAKALGYELVGTGFFPEWGNEEVYRCFNAKNEEIEQKVIEEQLKEPDGKRAFHPVRRKIGKEKIEDLRR